MKFPVFSLLTGNFGLSETGSLETASSSGESDELSLRAAVPDRWAPTERLRTAALLSVPHSPVEVISPFFVAPRERKQIELRIGEMAFILGDGQQLGRGKRPMPSGKDGGRQGPDRDPRESCIDGHRRRNGYCRLCGGRARREWNFAGDQSSAGMVGEIRPEPFERYDRSIAQSRQE